MKYIEKRRIRTHIYTYIRIYARERRTVYTVCMTKKGDKICTKPKKNWIRPWTVLSRNQKEQTNDYRRRYELPDRPWLMDLTTDY